MVSEKKKACRNCGGLNTGKECVYCGSNDFADKYKGRVLIFDSEGSEVAKQLGIEKNGEFALKF